MVGKQVKSNRGLVRCQWSGALPTGVAWPGVQLRGVLQHLGPGGAQLRLQGLRALGQGGLRALQVLDDLDERLHLLPWAAAGHAGVCRAATEPLPKGGQSRKKGSILE